MTDTTMLLVFASFGFLLHFGGVIWGVSRLVQGLRDLINANKEEANKEHGSIRETALRNQLDFQKQIDSLAAYCRDNFIRKESFNTIMAEHNVNIRTLFDRFETRFIRSESKLDEIGRALRVNVIRDTDQS